MENTSTVSGNLYSNGPIVGTNSSQISGDAVSAGLAGSANGIDISGDLYAHTIQNSDIGADAFYTTISGSTVGGTSFPGSPDQATTTLPFSDSQVEQWKQDATAGGIISSPCPYTIDADTTLGPVKITCDLIISQDPTITLSGAVWVEGNISISNTAIIRLASSFGALSTGMIADRPSNRTTSSKINLSNSVTFLDSGTAGSYIVMLSQNNSAEIGGGEKAIDVSNTVNGDVLLYAGHGEILLQNSVNLRQVTGYRIRLKNSTNVSYETGLASLLFSTGPGAGWSVTNWREIQ